MKSFGAIIEKKKTYQPFLNVMMESSSRLDRLRTHIREIRPFQPSLYKITEIGSLLGCYYEIFSNREYGEALLYSFSFHGYIQNMLGISANIRGGRLGFATFADVSGNSLSIKNQYYPALSEESYVTNDANLAQNMVITGPNAAGKTTFLKTTMLNIIFTQQFGCGFYSACSMKPYTHIHSYLNIPDTSGRDSLFQAESRRCKEIIHDVLEMNDGARHFCIFDELYSGTNPAEATKSAYSFLLWLSERPNVDFILTTHYIDICSRFKKSNKRIRNWKMDAVETESGDIRYTYKIVKGISKIQGAIKVLRDMDYPKEIIDTIMAYDK
jgi:dsDNA-specific endonuclease/ATPase MutS2